MITTGRVLRVPDIIPDPDADLRTAGFVYFVREHPTGPIKIGFTESVGNRLEQLRAASKAQLALIGYLPGTLALEQLLHLRFDKYRIDGEWFSPVKRVVKLANRLSRWSRERETPMTKRLHGPSVDVWFAEEENRAPGFIQKVDWLVFKSHIAATMKAMRLKAGLSQTLLAKKLGVRQPVIARIESGKSAPDISTMFRIAYACGYVLSLSFRKIRKLEND